MRVLSTKQIRELDAYTIQHEPISSIDLMERASLAFVDWFVMRVGATEKVGIVCGTGNNGGDGLAIARLLQEWNYAVTVWVVRGGAFETEDFAANLRRLPDKLEKKEIKSDDDPVSFDGYDVLIDALFGSGLSRPAAGVYARVIERINASAALRVCVDIPSGLMADSPSSGAIVKADYTVSFQLPKLTFFLPQSHHFTGEWVLVDIGLSKKFINSTVSSYLYTGLKDVRKMIKARSRYDHKGTYGHAMLIAGSYGKMGAAILAARGALRAGLGLLSVCVPGEGYPILQTAVPEAMVQVDADRNILTTAPDVRRYDALGIGPGLGQDERTKAALIKTLEAFGRPAVLDADALNLLGANRHMFNLVAPGSILTPHPKEFERLTGPWKDDFERLEMQRQLAVSLKAIVVLKGGHTSIATEKGLFYFNSTGNPGMATGGTGDVLTGILTSLLAQKYTGIEAAVAGVFLHGLAGDLAVSEYGMDSLIASDLVDYLPGAFLKVLRK